MILTEAQQRYQEYLKSEHWQRTRARILARADDHCERCGRFCGQSPHGKDSHASCGDPSCEWCQTYFVDGMLMDVERQTLEVHHLTYERRGRELDSDLIALCWSCHEDRDDPDRTGVYK